MPIPFRAFQRKGEIGLLTFTDDSAEMIPLPLRHPNTLSPPP